MSKKPSYNCLQALAHIFSGSVSNCTKYKLSFIKSNESDLEDSELLTVKTESFEKDGKAFFAYWLPYSIQDEPILKRIVLTMPYIKEMKNPVILDPLTRDIYSISNSMEFLAPITDYPMFVIDRESVSDIAEFSEFTAQKAAEEKIEQIIQE